MKREGKWEKLRGGVIKRQKLSLDGRDREQGMRQDEHSARDKVLVGSIDGLKSTDIRIKVSERIYEATQKKINAKEKQPQIPAPHPGD